VTQTYATWKEIISQPETWQATLSGFAGQRAELERFLDGATFARVLAIGCGSTHYLAQSAAAMLSRHARIPANAFPSSEIWLSPEAMPPGDTLLLAISRSGTTTETLRAVDRFREVKDGPVLAVSCYPQSDLVQASDLALLAPDAQEVSIAQTRSFSSMFVLTQALTGLFAEDEALIASLDQLPGALSDLVGRFGDIPQRLGADLNLERFYFLGGGQLYGLASEAMLKMKEMTLSYSEAYHPLEFRHGPMSMVNDQTLVVGLVPDTGQDEVIKVLVDMQRLGAHILALAEDERAVEPVLEGADVIALKSGLEELARSSLVLPPLQHLAYHRAIAKGFDPDHPHNLTAVVSLA
jgi:glucosamine--fructose-6-phosphate aminotransferase (isomerizing)